MNNAITNKQISDRAGNRLELPPMATRCEPSQRAYARAREQQSGQRIARERREAMALLRQLEPDPQRPAALPSHTVEPDPAFGAEFIAGLIAGLAVSGLVAAALILGEKL